ncbi:MAG: NADH-quinone oxidoreductase subunit NuoE [Coriobacteriia bacterium]
MGTTEEEKTVQAAAKRGEHASPDAQEIDRLLAPFEDCEADLVAALQTAQAEFGYLPKAVLERAAIVCGVPLSRVYGVATFYSQFHLRPRGKNLVKICHGTACYVRGAPEITSAVTEELGIRPGETTDDLSFTVETVACVGCCGLAPVMLVNDDTMGQLDADKARRTIVRLKEDSA